MLVTGAGGFAGSHVVRELRDNLRPHGKVFGSFRPGMPSNMGRGVEAVPLDVSDAEQVTDVIRSITPSHVVHLAAISTVASANISPDLAWKVNLFGSINIANALQEYSPGSQLIFASSAEVYGRSFQGGPVDEDTPLRPSNLYACAKAAAELTLAQMASTRLRVVRVRPFNHVGPGQSEKFVTAAFAAQVARIEQGLQPAVIRVGNLDAVRDFLDVRDLAVAYRRMLECADELPDEPVLNVASGTTRTIQSILEDVLSLSRTPIEVMTDGDRIRSSDVRVVSGSAQRTRDLLGWAPAYDWMDTVRAILEDWRARVHAPRA